MRRRATRIGKMIVAGHLFADDIGHLARRVMQANIVGACAARKGVKLGNAVFVYRSLGIWRRPPGRNRARRS